jgi:type I restriction enzyme S subunit
MKIDWEILEFEKSIVKINYTNKVKRKDFLEEGLYPIISQEKELINGFWNNINELFKIKQPVVIFGDHTKVIKYIDFDFVLGADGVKILQPIEAIFPKYFYYFLLNTKLKNLGYARHYRLLKETKIYYPKSLKEQKRIVKILDKVFAAIGKAKENIENNLKNSRELFESYSNEIFDNPGKEWEEKKLGEVIKLEYGKSLDKSRRILNGKYPVYGANGEIARSNEYYYCKKSIIVGRKGSAGEINLTDEYFWALDVTYFVTFDEKQYNIYYLYHLLDNLNLQKLAKGVKPGINRNDVYSIIVPIPSLHEQKRIVFKLDNLSTETKHLEKIYRQKINDLIDLKKSILQKAFEGKL